MRIATSEPLARMRRATSSPEMSGQADVEDDDLDPGRRVDDVEAVLAGRRGLHDVAVLLEQSPQKANEARIVLDDEQMHVFQPNPSFLARPNCEHRVRGRSQSSLSAPSLRRP